MGKAGVVYRQAAGQVFKLNVWGWDFGVVRHFE